MELFKKILPSSSRFQEIEFAALLGWALLFPAKQSYAYFLGFNLLLVAFSLRKIFILKNIALTRFSSFLLFFNGVFIFSAFFSPYPLKSILFASDIFLLSLYSILIYLEKSDMDRYLRLLAWIISFSSLAVVVFFAGLGWLGPVAPVFKNTILQGIASALAALVFLHALLQKYSHRDAILFALNFAAVVISASKAAFLGLALFAAFMIFSRRRKWLVHVFIVLLLLLLVPNPLRRMAVHSLRDDPYVLNRLDIWNMSARMFRHHFWTGVGPDLFPEAAKRFNFSQEKGPARYFKLPESPHSDYWKIITENGLPGLLFVLLFLFFAMRRLLWPSWFDLPRSLLAFLLLQMLLFNYIFNFFFLLVFFFLLRDFFLETQCFVSPGPALRIFLSSMLVFLLVVLYVFPYLGNRCLDAAAGEQGIVRRFSLLRRAALFSPLDPRPSLAKAEVLRSFARISSNMEAWSDAWENLRLAQKLDGYDTSALLSESALFADLAADPRQYPARGEEILAPLRRAEVLDPFNPFLKLRMAEILRRFDRSKEAMSRTRAALALEPEYAAAILFLHELEGRPAADPALRERMARIRAKADRLRARPGSYLFQLHQLPAPAAGY